MTDDEIKQLIAAEVKRSAADPRLVAFETATMNAWQTNRMEFDKSLLTLSAGGIALSITLLTQFGIASENVLRSLEAAVAAFAASALCVFVIYKQNAAYLKTTFSSSVAQGSAGLRRLDLAAALFVAIGVILLSYGGILSAEFKFRKEQNMTKTTQTPVGVVTPDKLHEGSVEQWETFRPAKPQPTEQQAKPAEPEKPAPPPAKPEKPAGK